MSQPSGIKKVVHRIMITLFSFLEVLGLPRVPKGDRKTEAAGS